MRSGIELSQFLGIFPTFSSFMFNYKIWLFHEGNKHFEKGDIKYVFLISNTRDMDTLKE